MRDRICLRIEVNHINSFLRYLYSMGINLYSIKKDHQILEVIIPYKDFEKVKKIKTIKKLTIVNTYGIPKMKNIFHQYLFLLLFFILGLLINCILSQMIFTVEIDCTNKKLLKTVQKDLKRYGISPYHFKVSFEKKEKIKESILLLEKDKIEWMEIEEHGTKIIVQVEERKLKKEEESCLPRNIVSTKNASITRMDVIRGEIVKKKNDIVSRGEIVVSGEIHNKDEVVSQECSIGTIYGEVWYKVRVEVPEKQMKYQKTKNYTLGVYSINHQNKKFFHEKYSYSDKTMYPIITSNIYPVSIGFVTYQRLIPIKEQYNLYTVDSIAYQKALIKLKEKTKEEPNVLRKKILKKEIKNSKIIIEVFFAVEENITSYQNIEKEE